MPNRTSNGPLQITSLDLTSINYMLQQIRRELDELKGLRGPIQFENDVSSTGAINLSNAQYDDEAATVIPFDTTGTTGVETTVARSDHTHNATVTAGQAISVAGSATEVTVGVANDPTFVGEVTLSTGGLTLGAADKDIDLSAITAGNDNFSFTPSDIGPAGAFYGRIKVNLPGLVLTKYLHLFDP